MSGSDSGTNYAARSTPCPSASGAGPNTSGRRSCRLTPVASSIAMQRYAGTAPRTFHSLMDADRIPRISAKRCCVPAARIALSMGAMVSMSKDIRMDLIYSQQGKPNSPSGIVR